MTPKKDEIIEHINALDTINDDKRNAMIEKINEWKTDAHAESNSLAVYFEKFWIELEPIFAEMGLI